MGLKFFSSVIATCLGSLAVADSLHFPWGQPSRYEATDQVFQQQAISTEHIFVSAPGSKDQIDQLRNDGYTCSYARPRFMTCRKFVHVIAPEHVHQRVRSRAQKLSPLEFLAVRALPSPLYDGESGAEYVIEQTVLVGQQTFHQYRFFKSRDILKLKLGNPSLGNYIEVFVVDDVTFAQQIRIRDGNDLKFVEYVFNAPFRKVR